MQLSKHSQRNRLLVLVMMFVGSAGGQSGQAADGPRPATAAVCAPPAQLIEALQQQLPAGRTQVSLEDLAELLRELLRVPVRIDRASLEYEGISLDEQLDWDPAGLSIGTALELLLEERDLDYVFRGEVLVLTSRAAAAELMYPELYDVADLCGPAGVARFDPYELKDLIEEGIPDAEWIDITGVGGRVKVVNELLVITHHRRVHAAVASLLADLRRVLKARESAPADERLILQSYRLEGKPAQPSSAGNAGASAHAQVVVAVNLVPIIRTSIEPESWGLQEDAERPALWAVDDVLLVRAPLATHRQIRSALKPFLPQPSADYGWFGFPRGEHPAMGVGSGGMGGP
jgi:hypothetical protein